MQDSNEIISQMGSFAASLLQINETLQALSATDRADHAALRGQLIDSREDLLDTLITLNKMMTMMTTSPDANGRFTVPADDQNRPVSIFKGSLLLAPRLFNSSMCFDFAIVVSISGSDAQAYSTQQSTAASLLDQSIDVLWVHPQSSYECYSQGISFAESQLRSTAMAIRCWDFQKLHLGQLKEGQRVMYRQHSRMAFFHRIDADKDACRYMASRTDSGAKQPLDPIWIVGEVDHIDSGSGGSEAAVAYVSVPSRACYPKLDGRKASVLCCKLDGTCLFPLPTANDEVLWRRDPCAGQELSSDSEEDVSDLPMTYRATVRSDPGPPVRPLCRALGDWEQHTRGIGSKILAKMGFSKHAGRGLGRFAQGIVAPVEGLVKPLPVGLSLDFISEEGCSKKSSSSGEDPSDRARDIRADIVSRFNGSHNKKTKAAVSSSRRDRDSKGSRPSDRSVFDFLNTMDANQSRHIGVDSTASSSSSSSSALKKSKVSQSGRSQRLDKLF